MRTETVTYKVYKFEELSEEQKQRAKEKFFEHDDFWPGRDILKTLKAFGDHFGAPVVDYNLDWAGGSYSDAKFNVPDEPPTEKELHAKLRELGTFNRRTLKGHGDCKLTGVCYDEDAVDGFRWAFYRQGVRDLGVLLEAGFRSLMKAARAEYDYQWTDEAFKDMCDANDYEFREDGRLV